jgi:hypothetical protein
MPGMPSERCVRNAFRVGYLRAALARYSYVLVGDGRRELRSEHEHGRGREEKGNRGR